MSSRGHSDSTEPHTIGLVVVTEGRAAVGRLADGRVVTDRTFERRVEKALPGESERPPGEEDAAAAMLASVAATAEESFGGEPSGPVVVGGTLTATERLLDDHLDQDLRERLRGSYTVEYAGERGLRQLAAAAAADLPDETAPGWQAPLSAFFDRLGGDGVVYGPAETKGAIRRGGVETLLVASTVPDDRRDELTQAAEQQDADWYVVPADAERGAQFAETFGGVGALTTPGGD